MDCLDCDYGAADLLACDQQLSDQMMAKARRHARDHAHNVHVERLLEGVYFGDE